MMAPASEARPLPVPVKWSSVTESWGYHEPATKESCGAFVPLSLVRIGGGGGIRTLEAGFPANPLSRRAP